jgi:hypothetical protein
LANGYVRPVFPAGKYVIETLNITGYSLGSPENGEF